MATGGNAPAMTPIRPFTCPSSGSEFVSDGHGVGGKTHVATQADSPAPPRASKHQLFLFEWIHTHQLLSRFRDWSEISSQTVNWIWEKRTEEGFWDLGRSAARRPYSSFLLSESRRRPQNRVIDSTVEMLGLLAKAC